MILRNCRSRLRRPSRFAGLAALALLVAGATPAQSKNQWRAAAGESTIRIELGKAGWLKAFGDEHVIAVSEYECRAEFEPAAPAGGSVQLNIAAGGLKVLDPQFSAEKRAEVQQKMEGAEVLDLARFPTIRFVSQRITATGANRLRVEGNLQIRQLERSVAFTLTLVAEPGGYRVRGEVPVKLSGFGIQPPTAAGGGVRVKDEMKVLFDILLVK